MSSDCFKELDLNPFNYTQFEDTLEDILVDIGYPTEQVVRWEVTDPSSSSTPDIEVKVTTTNGSLGHHKQVMKRRQTISNTSSKRRAGKITHFWNSLPGMGAVQYMKSAFDDHEQPPPPSKPFLVSTNLYFDVNHVDGASDIFRKTVQAMQLSKGSDYFPLGIIAGAFELGQDFFMHRNVAARLIAVAMGAAQFNVTSMENVTKDEKFWEVYRSACRDSLGLDPLVCDLQGFTSTSKIQYQSEWRETWDQWKDGICDRFTTVEERFDLKTYPNARKHNFQTSNEYFWETFNRRPTQRLPMTRSSETKGSNDIKIPPRAGVLLDFVNSGDWKQTFQILEQYIAPLKDFSMLQLRLVDSNGFAVELNKLGHIAYSRQADYDNPMPNLEDLSSIVVAAEKIGLQVIPEISLASGWIKGKNTAKLFEIVSDETTIDLSRLSSLLVFCF